MIHNLSIFYKIDLDDYNRVLLKFRENVSGVNYINASYVHVSIEFIKIFISSH